MRDDISALSVTSPGDFQTALAAIIETAIEEGVDVQGAWEFRTEGSTRDWELNITELAKRSPDGDHEER